MKYSEEELNKIENDIMSGIDAEQTTMSIIEDNAWVITDRLIKNKHTVEFFGDTKYIFSLGFNRDTKSIVVMRSDPIKIAIAGSKYIPAIFRGDWDFNFTFRENVYLIVKTALCSAAGIINVEDLGVDE